MTDINRYMEALKNADAAGDVEAAKMLASKIREMQSPAVARRAELERIKSQVMPDPSEGAGTLQFGSFDTGIPVPQEANRFLAGAGKAFTDVWRGLGSVGELANTAPSLEPGMTAEEIEAQFQKLNPSAQPTSLQSEINESRALDKPLMDTGAGIAGNITGNVVAASPTMLIPGVNTFTGAATVGAGMGALQPVTDDESRATNAALGGAGGLIGKGAASTVSRVLSPRTAPAARELLDEGVPLTPGQILGGTAQRAEDGLTSVPVVGDFIKASQGRAVEGFNRAALNKVLSPIGEKSSKIGREGLEEAYEKVTGAYTRLLPKLKVEIDPKFTNELRAVLSLSDSLPEASKKQLHNIIKTQVASKFSLNGRMSGEAMKEVDSELGRIARGYMSSSSFEGRELGSAIRAVQQSLRGMVQRSNPGDSARLRAIDSAYSNLLRVENAGSRAGAHEGVFSPAQLKAAAKQMDPTLRKRGFAHGSAPMQRFAEDSQRILGSSVPDSGTPFRLANMLAVGGGYAIDPSVAAGMAIGSGAYTKAGQQALAAALAKRPEIARAAGDAVSDRAALAAILGSATLTGSRQAQ